MSSQDWSYLLGALENAERCGNEEATAVLNVIHDRAPVLVLDGTNPTVLDLLSRLNQVDFDASHGDFDVNILNDSKSRINRGEALTIVEKHTGCFRKLEVIENMTYRMVLRARDYRGVEKCIVREMTVTLTWIGKRFIKFEWDAKQGQPRRIEGTLRAADVKPEIMAAISKSTGFSPEESDLTDVYEKLAVDFLVAEICRDIKQRYDLTLQGSETFSYDRSPAGCEVKFFVGGGNKWVFNRMRAENCAADGTCITSGRIECSWQGLAFAEGCNDFPMDIEAAITFRSGRPVAANPVN